jgi:hypothetical protein
MKSFHPRKYNKEIMQQLVEKSVSIAGILSQLGLKKTGGNYRHIQKILSHFCIDISHFTGQRWNSGLTKEDHASIKTGAAKISLTSEEIFIENASPSVKRKHLIEGMNKLGISYQCDECDNPGVWRGQPITLHVDHKNGINNDNRLENLHYLCPNCHQQTPTWGNHK